MTTPEERIAHVLEIAMDATIVGAHHKQWIIDQMVRALTDCPTVKWTGIDVQGNAYTYTGMGESDAYLAWLQAFHQRPRAEGDVWDAGIAP